MEETMFLLQETKGRGGRYTGGLLLKQSDLYDEEYMNSILKRENTLMYGSTRGYMNDCIHMSKEEFEEVFSGHIDEVKYLLNGRGIFRKEVIEAFSDEGKPKYKVITKLEIGHIYADVSGNKWLYMGNVKFHGECEISWGGRKNDITLGGNMYIPVCIYTEPIIDIEKVKFDIADNLASWGETVIGKWFLKGKKKIVKDLGNSGITLEDLRDCTVKLPKSYLYSYERTVKFKLY